MKIVGRNTKHKKGFTEDLNRFFQLIAAFRKDKLLKGLLEEGNDSVL